MKYVKWFLLALLDLLFTAQCYITNPIVVLFATEDGQLPTLFTWWANWDDGLDVEWMVTEHKVPKFAEYDFNRHYKYFSPSVAATMGVIGVLLIDRDMDGVPDQWQKDKEDKKDEIR